jgi:hypothetical protein
MARLPVPGPSYLKERTVRLGGPDAPAITLGMNAPTSTDDGWWLTLIWAHDPDGILDARQVAPPAGPPADPPLLVLGPAFAGALSGLIAQENGRQVVRLRLPPAADESRPWERPLIVQLALKWDPIRAATMTPNQLASEALDAFGRALEAARRPG